MIIGYTFYFINALTKQSLLRREDKCQELRTVGPWMQSVTTNSLTAVKLMKSYRIGQ